MDKVFDYLKDIFNKNGFRLYMIGSSSRDYLLKRNILDYDFVTDATPEEISTFLNVDLTFKKFGSVKLFLDPYKIDIVTLRKEDGYQDFRHPKSIKYIKDINIDYLRRDLTINAIYIDENYNVLDPSKSGLDDLKNKKLRYIGSLKDKIDEDPLRILRIFRFIKEYNLKIDKESYDIILNNFNLISFLNKDKIKEEFKKYMKVTL